MPRRSLKSRVLTVLPRPAKNLLISGQALVSVCRGISYDCNICRYSGRFLPYGQGPVRDARCPRCGSIERSRLVGLWIDANLDKIAGARMLHFSPDPGLASLFKDRVGEYRCADIQSHRADEVLNIESIDLPNESVDLVMCSHVLEHVDDAKALHEIYRILTPGGSALLMVPIVDGWERTYENPAHTSDADRIRYYGQADHVRFYGRDVRERIRDAGFVLTEFTAEEPEVSQYNLERGDHIFIATKC
jgi:SAM-dependent methyltransferase